MLSPIVYTTGDTVIKLVGKRGKQEHYNKTAGPL
jgi:hypothetical protein